MPKEEKADMMTMSQQIDNIKKEIHTIQENQIEILEVKSKNTQKKISLERLSSRFKQIQEKISELEDNFYKLCNINTQKRNLKNGQNLREHNIPKLMECN